MLRRLLIGAIVLVLAIGALTAGAGLGVITAPTGIEQPKPAQVLPATDRYREVPTLSVWLEQGKSGTGTTVVCQQASCREQSRPLNIPAEAVFDGESWYYYADDGGLHRRASNGEDSLIVSSTELVTPRDAVVDAAGSALAYWLDNITEDDNDLTELWKYDIAEGGTSIVAEKLVASDIVTSLRWNSAGTALMFVADSGKGSEEKLEFIVVNTEPAHIQARFGKADIQLLTQVAEEGLIDISPAGTMLAFAQAGEGKSTLQIVRDGSLPQRVPVVGTIPFIQWIGEGQLLYAVQQGNAFELRRWVDATHTSIGRQSGQLLSALATEGGSYIAYATREGSVTSLHIFEMATGLSRKQSNLVAASSDIRVKRVEATEKNALVAGISSELTDGQLISFIESNLDQIAEPNAKLVRIVISSSPNTLYLDYIAPKGETRRTLLTVRDAIHPEWVIKAHYEPLAGEWRKIDGNTSGDPAPARLYEWEKAAKQWILKSEY